MVNNSSSNTAQVARILYKEIVAGDLRKIGARSNDSDTGGGARDFRFGEYPMLASVIAKMFPGTIQETRKRGGVSTLIQISKGCFSWHDKTGAVHTKESFFEPPTDVRPSEGRIARVHEYPCFDPSLIPKGGVGNRVLLLIIQLEDETVWPYFAAETSLRTTGVWDPSVAATLINCMDANRAAGRAVIGYRDFVSGESYCNGK